LKRSFEKSTKLKESNARSGIIPSGIVVARTSVYRALAQP